MSKVLENSPRSCGLLDQPHEVLFLIVGFLPRYGFVKFVDEDGIKRNVSQYLVLAQVCERLRKVVLAADFWQESDFPFGSLVGVYSAASFAVRVGGLMKALLEDRNFVNSLKRRKEWVFDYVEPLLAVVMSGSWFWQGAESVTLQYFQDGEATSALKALSLCRQITQLCIAMRPFDMDYFGPLDLCLISECLPNLRKLTIEFNEFKGTLDGLTHLTNLKLSSAERHMEVIPEKWVDLIPLSSRSTLQSLNVGRLYSFTNILNNFSNLTHLTCGDLNKDMITTLTTLTDVKLHSLRVYTWGDEIPKLSRWWTSECLKNLKQLHLRFQDVGSSRDFILKRISQHIINSSFSRLQTLEHLILDGGFDLAWCPYLTALKRLQCLQLATLIPNIGCTLREAYPELEGLRDFLLGRKKAAEIIAILGKEFGLVPKFRFVEGFYHPDFAMEDFNCLCGEHV